MAEKEGIANLTIEDTDKPVTDTPLEVEVESLKPTIDTSLSNTEGSQSQSKDKTKIDILLKATGNAPIMKKKKWAVNPDQHIGWISEFVKKYLKLDVNERLIKQSRIFMIVMEQTAS
ncbi:autophagy protein 12-like isoform X2 [Chelonus insularis]|uniref:autophagy protein 12-like isoform X2 n=1 Tax=Chelonus insularis TaxID=460826 RepID=UPI001589D017|nr:autophagy protein 12-like isoform X2 [Chelonus insularis]